MTQRLCSKRLRSFVVSLLAFAALSLAARAQCSNPWLVGSGTPGVLGGSRQVLATCVWDRDGAGPQPPVVVVGGDFSIAGAQIANRVAAFDPTTETWSSVGNGFGGEVRALLVMPNGELVAGGNFASGIGIARFDGTNWWPLGGGVTGQVLSLALLPNGDLIAGGYFTAAGGVAAANIARWDGIGWAPLGTGIGGGDVRALAVMPNGDLIAGGYYSSAGGAPAQNIARWDGAAWSSLGLGLDSAVQSLLVRSTGDLVAGGYFNYSGPSSTPGLNHVASWDGTSWSSVGAGVAGSAWSLAELPNGDLVVGCFQSQQSILKWNGTAWAAMNAVSDGAGQVFATCVLPNGNLIAGGSFYLLGGTGAGSVARWDGSSWTSLGNGLTGGPGQLAELADGSVVAMGGFTVGQSRGLAIWTGVRWEPFPVPLDGIACIGRLPNGDLLAAGVFPSAGVDDNLALWNGTSWSTFAPGLVGTGLFGQVTGITVRPGGEIVACGTFAQRLAVWNGSAWSSLGTVQGATPVVNHLATAPNGDLVVAGYFTAIGGVAADNIARWDGNVWAPLGPGVILPLFSGAITMLAVLPDGDVVVGGVFGIAGAGVGLIARWNGATWSPLGTGLNSYPTAALALPNGDLVVGGNFTSAGGVPAQRIARWNGTSWTAFGAGTDLPASALALRANGDLLVGGPFLTAGGSVSPYFAAISTTCPATAVVSGAGCTGSGGPNVLTPETLPWLGTTFRARATGLPSSSFALIATGVTPLVLPLAQLFPQGGPGCTAWLLADGLDVALPIAGEVTTQIAVPNVPSLVGAQLHQQVLVFVFDAFGNLIELTGSNSLTISPGVF